ncbi:MAG TPA: hypothetical protein VHZ09_18445 [Acidobacteriaceae bacterium]|jgi:hypothetical protein|nr:hypothetical protein [Acidobacteriaceae bacterium]
MKTKRQWATLGFSALFGAALAMTPMGAFASPSPQSDQGTSAKQDMKDAGHDTKQGAKDAGHGVKKGTKKAYHSTKRGTKKAWHKTKNTTKGAVNGGKEGAREPQ